MIKRGEMFFYAMYNSRNKMKEGWHRRSSKQSKLNVRKRKNGEKER